MSLIAAVYSSVLGLRKRTWVSGMTVRKNEVVKSPADNEDYERVTATGAGTTDPADDITNYVARSYVRTAALPEPPLLNSPLTPYGATAVALPTLGVGTRVLGLSITGRGSIDYLSASKGATETFRVEVIVDGRAVSNYTLNMTTSNSALIVGSPGWDGGSNYAAMSVKQPDGIVFKRSFVVYLTAVVTQSTYGRLFYNVRSHA